MMFVEHVRTTFAAHLTHVTSSSRLGRLMAEDSNHLDWIYIVRSVSVREWVRACVRACFTP